MVRNVDNQSTDKSKRRQRRNIDKCKQRHNEISLIKLNTLTCNVRTRHTQCICMFQHYFVFLVYFAQNHAIHLEKIMVVFKLHCTLVFLLDQKYNLQTTFKDFPY